MPENKPGFKHFSLSKTHDDQEYFVNGELSADQPAKLVILDNAGNLVSRQIMKLVKGDNSIPVPKTVLSDAAIHVIILYLNNEVVFSELIMRKTFLPG